MATAGAVKAGDLFWNITGDDSSLEKALKSSSGLIKKASIGLVAVGGGITAALGVATNSAVGFGTAMAEVNTLGVDNLEALGDSVKDVAARFGQDVTASAKAAYQAISAGAKEAEVPLILESAAKAAAAGITDLQTSVELGMGTMNAFGGAIESVDQVFDLAFIAVKNGVTTFEDLSASTGKLSPLFAAAGLGADEMFASIATLTKGGVATAEAVTGMKAAITNIVKPTEAMMIAFEDVGGPMKVLEESGLPGFLDVVKEKTGGSVEKMGKLFGSVEALNAVLALTGTGADEFNRVLEESKNSVGATDEAFKKLIDADPAFAFRQLRSSMEVLAIEIGEALLPMLKNVIDFVGPIVRGTVEWVKNNQGATEAIVLLTAAVGGLALGLGTLGLILPPIIGGLGFLGLGTAATAAAGTAGGATGIAGVTTAITGFGVVVAGVGLASLFGIAAAAFEARKAHVALRDGIEDANQSLINQAINMREAGIAIDENEIATLSRADAEALIAQRANAHNRAIRENIAVTQQSTAVKTQATKVAFSAASASDAEVLAKKFLIDMGLSEAEATELSTSKKRESAEAILGQLAASKEAKAASEKFVEQQKQATQWQINENVERIKAVEQTGTFATSQGELTQAYQDLEQISMDYDTTLQSNTDSTGEMTEAQKKQNEAMEAALPTMDAIESILIRQQRGLPVLRDELNAVSEAYAAIKEAANSAATAMARAGGGGGGGGGNVPSLARGGNIVQGGAVDIHSGERVILPTGAEVVPRQEVQASRGGGGGINMTIQNLRVDGSGITDPGELTQMIGEQLAEITAGELRATGVPMGAF